MMTAISIEPLKKAFQTFEESVENPPGSLLERDGIIQRFEYTLDLSWKSIAKVLRAFGRSNVPASPKPLFRIALEENFIDSVDPWFRFIDARNRTSHTYNQLTADQVFRDIGDFYTHMKALIVKLEEALLNV